MWDTAIPTTYAAWTFATFPVNAADGALRNSFEPAQGVARTARGLYVLAGGSGVGKTGLAISIVQAINSSSILCVDGFTLMVRLIEMVSGKRSQSILDELLQPDVLFIDDLGYAISSETASRQAATQAVQQLLVKRLDKLTLITLSGHSSDQATYAEFCAWLGRVGRVIDLGAVNLRERLLPQWEQPKQTWGGTAAQRLRLPAQRLDVAAPSRAPAPANLLQNNTPAQFGNATDANTTRPDVADQTPSPRLLPTLTICFICQGERVLLINRKKPPLMGLWNGVGGKLEPGETALAGILREVEEETGLVLPSVQASGIVSWQGEIEPDSMFVFTAHLPDETRYETPKSTREGILAWHELQWIYDEANEGVVSNIRRYLPTMLAGQTDLEHRLLYKGGKLVGYETRPLS